LCKPSLLILYEAASALDSENERSTQKAIKGLHNSTTKMIITYWLSIVCKADVIYVLEEGAWPSLVIRILLWVTK